MFARNDEETAFVRHAAGNQRGVTGREQSDVSVGYGLPLFVDDGALVAVCGFLRTLDGDFCAVDAHADGIEAYHLADGIGHGLTTNGGGDAEVLQLVVEEIDFNLTIFLISLIPFPQGKGWGVTMTAVNIPYVRCPPLSSSSP